MTDRASVETFNKLMKAAIGDSYLIIVTEIIQLHAHILNELESKEIDGVPISQRKFTARFWRAFITSVKKNSKNALAILKNPEFKSDDDFIKAWRNTSLDLLSYLDEFGAHGFVDDKTAAKFFTKNELTSPETVKKLLFHSSAA
uniref:Uncharacterized protein n=1 Tax=Panagrolaimus superbus TaxID=310955 RepID=A0A914YFQ9_9BILA